MNNCVSMVRDVDHKPFELNNFSLFGAFSEAQINKLWRYVTIRSYAAGSKIFQRGDLPSEIYVLASGRVDFVLEKYGVASVETSFLEGATFGESAYLGIQPHVGTTYVRGHDVAEVVVLTRDALIALSEEDPSLFSMLIMNLTRELSRKYQAVLEAMS